MEWSQRNWLAVTVIVISLLATIGFSSNIIQRLNDQRKPAESKDVESNTKNILFGDYVVNLKTERLNRYLKLRLILVVDSDSEREVNRLLTKRKEKMKSWLNSYFMDQTVEDVSGSIGYNRVRQEMRDQFNIILDERTLINEILFEDFYVQ